MGGGRVPAEAAGVVRLKALEPDPWTLSHATYIQLKPCPFCGREGPLPLSYANDDSPFHPGKTIYRVIVECASMERCGGETSANHSDLEEARRLAIERWQARA